MPGTCRSRTTSSSGWRRAARARLQIVPAGSIEMIQMNTTDPWTEVEGERASVKSQASLRSPTPPCARPSACSWTAPRSRRTSTGAPGSPRANFLNQPARFRSPNNKMGVQHRQGEPGARCGGLEAGRRRHAREGWQEAQVRLPDLDQRAAPEGAVDREAGVPEGGHRPRAEEHQRVGVLLFRRRQPGYVQQVLRRHPDVQHHDAAARSRALHESVVLVGGGDRRTTSGRDATSRAGATRTTTAPTAPPKASSIR